MRKNPRKEYFFNDSNSNNNSNNSSNSNSENKKVPSNVGEKKNNVPPAVAIQNNINNNDEGNEIEIEFENLKEYFTEMRAKFDPELFISKRKTKDKLITDKKEEA